MAETSTVVLYGVVPIPLGHEIEVFYLSRDVGLFGKDIQVQLEEPMIHDLTTGIWYGRIWHFAPGNDAKVLTARSADPAPGVQVASSFRGVVRGCVVVTDGHMREQCAGTTLHVEATK